MSLVRDCWNNSNDNKAFKVSSFFSLTIAPHETLKGVLRSLCVFFSPCPCWITWNHVLRGDVGVMGEHMDARCRPLVRPRLGWAHAHGVWAFLTLFERNLFYLLHNELRHSFVIYTLLNMVFLVFNLLFNNSFSLAWSSAFVLFAAAWSLPGLQSLSEPS